MQLLRQKAKELLIFLIIMTLTILIYTLLVYSGHATNEPIKFRITSFLIGLILFLVLGFFSGNIEQKKGWIAGLSSALVVIIFVIIIQLFAKDPFTFDRVLKYLAYLSAGTFGGILGVNFKRLF